MSAEEGAETASSVSHSLIFLCHAGISAGSGNDQSREQPLTRAAILLLLGLCGSVFAAPAVVTTTDGDDWSMPAWAKLTPNAGWVGWSSLSWAQKRAQLPHYQTGAIHLGVCVSYSWNELNPSESVFDWKALDATVARIAATPGVGFMLWIRSYNKMDKEEKPDQPEIPPWVVQKGKVKFLSNGLPAAWEPGCEFQKYYGLFLRALGERYRNHPRLLAVDMRGLDCEYGEWCWRGGLPLIEEAEAKTSLNPDTFRAWGVRFLDDHLEAFKGQEKKLVLMHCGNMIWARGAKNDYSKASEEIWRKGLARGCGYRDGMIEVWNGYIAESYGMRLSDGGYIEVIEDYPAIKNNAVSYTENEGYCGHGGFAPKETDAVRWFVSTMRALQMRRNWIWPSNQAVDELLPQFNRWVEFSLGKTVDTSPDAWCLLREGYLADWQKNRAVKNFERFLTQRDVKPDGFTVPEEKIDISKMNQEESGKGYEFHARRTDSAKGSRNMYFKAERKFIDTATGKLQLKVTYLDAPNAKWCVEFTGKNGTERSAEIANSGSGKWKTATLNVQGLRAAGAMAEGMDFRIAALSGDVTVKFVRLVKLDPPVKK
jgi:hypothetical protein